MDEQVLGFVCRTINLSRRERKPMNTELKSIRVSHILGLAVYTTGNLAFRIISPEMGIFTLDANGVISGNPSRVTQAVYTCVILTVMMMLGALLLLASPYISYKLFFGQIFEAISTT